MVFCVIVLSSLFFACLEPSKGQNWQNRLLQTHSGSNNDADASDQNNDASQTSLFNSTDRLTVYNQRTRKQIQTSQTFSSSPAGDHIKQTNVDDQSIPSWINTINQEHTKQNQNNLNKNNTNINLPSISDLFVNRSRGVSNRTQEYITDGKPVSTDNWDVKSVFKVIPGGIIGGDRLTSAKQLLLQWHVGIYSKAFQPYMQICGGTLVTTKAVISAAHCFWSDLDGALSASLFMAAAGKLYRPWNDPQDLYAQKSEISAIHLPTRFHGAITSFQDDIAAVLLATALTHSPALRPLCVLFDEDLEHAQLRKGNEGIVLGWGLTAENGLPAQALQYLNMPYVPTEECVVDSDANFLKYITSDKICAGVTTGKVLCRGDSGGGLVFFVETSNERVPLLLGVASTAPRNEHLCNTHARATLTRVLAHRTFLRTAIPDIEEACGKNYVAFSSNTLEASLIDNRWVEPENIQAQAARPGAVKFICNCYCNNSNKN